MANTTPTDFSLTGPYDEATREDVGSMDEAAQQDPVWGSTWNPHVNRWAPSDEPVDADADVEVHADVPHGTPMSEQWGQPLDEGGGSIPDARANYLTDVNQDRGPTPPPRQIVQHEVHTYDTGGEIVRARSVVVVGNTTPTRLLDENPNRKRALIKVITSASVVLIGPAFGAMGSPQLTAIPTTPLAAWAQATGDPTLEIKSQAAVDALGITAAGTVLISIWEETNSLGGPGLAG